MTDLDNLGISVNLPQGWEGRVFRRPAAGEVAASAADGLAAEPGQTTNAVVHVATISLPPGVGDFASGAVEKLGALDALIVLFEYDREAATTPLFAAEGLPRVLSPADFSPTMLQRALRGQAGVQHFFHEAGRAFCLYVVLGAYQNRARIVPEVNRVLATFAIEGGSPPPVAGDVLDVIGARADHSTFAALVEESGLAPRLSSGAAVTAFAPVDGAFTPAATAALRADPDLLRQTILQHVVEELLPADVLVTRTTLTTAAGGTLAVRATASSLTVNGAVVAPPPEVATNGLVYATNLVFEAPR